MPGTGPLSSVTAPAAPKVAPGGDGISAEHLIYHGRLRDNVQETITLLISLKMDLPDLSQVVRPSFSDLPLRKDDPPYSAWGLWGKNDQLGTLVISQKSIVGIRIDKCP